MTRARNESPYGTTIAHGFLTLSLLSQMLNAALQIEGCRHVINYGLNRVRFPAPVLAEARLRGHFTLQAMEPVPGGTQVTWLATVAAEGQAKPALVAEWLLRYYL
jgi:acyl dehydratase